MTELLTPTFIGIGAPRCGTRWMAQCLAEHPQVSIADTEVYFFTRRRVVWSFWDRGRVWYDQRLRSGWRTGARAIGEITPVYIFDDDTPGLIHSVAPQAKLICCVRDQSRRAESWYRLFLRFNPTISPDAYPIEKFLTYQNDVFGREGFYLEHLDRFWRFFSRQQVLVLCYDDLERDPAGFVRRVFSFIGVADDFVPGSLARRINRLAPGVESGCQDRVPVVDSQDAVEKFRMSSVLRSRMFELYASHNESLGCVLNRDLSHWNR